MEVPLMQYPPGDPRVVDRIASQLKSQGIFDQFRKECISDVDTKPAYQNLHQRVEGTVASFLANQEWRPDLNKNQLRDSLRKHIHESGFLDIGVERIVDQVVNPKIMTVFLPQIEDVVYHCLGIEKPRKGQETQTGPMSLPPNIPQKLATLKDLLPTGLDPISPESDGIGGKDFLSEDENEKEEESGAPEDEEENVVNDNEDDEEEEEDDEEEVSPPFEPIEEVNSPCEDSCADSHLSGISELTSHDSQISELSFGGDSQITSAKIPMIDLANHDSQLSKVSSGSRLSIVFSDDQKPPSSPPEIDITNDESQMSKLSLQICQESQGSFIAEMPDQESKESKHAECIVVKDSSSDASNLDTTTSSSKSSSIVVCENDRMKVISEDDTQELDSSKADTQAQREQIEKKYVPEKDDQMEGKIRNRIGSESDLRKNENNELTSGSERKKSDKHYRGRGEGKTKTERSGRHGERSSKSDDRHKENCKDKLSVEEKSEKDIRKDKIKMETKNERIGNEDREDKEKVKYGDSAAYRNKSKYSDSGKDVNVDKMKHEGDDDSDDSEDNLEKTEDGVKGEDFSDKEEMTYEGSTEKGDIKDDKSRLKYDDRKEIEKNKERESGKGKGRHEERSEKDRGKLKSEDKLERQRDKIEKEGNKVKSEEKLTKDVSKERSRHGEKYDKDREKSGKERSRHSSKNEKDVNKSKYDGKTEREGSSKHKTEDKNEKEFSKDKSKQESRSRKDSSKERSKHSDKGDREKTKERLKYDDKEKGSNKKKENADEVDGDKKEKSRSETRKDKTEKSRPDDKSRSKGESKHKDNTKTEGSSKHGHDRSKNRDKHEGKESEKKKDEKSHKDRTKTGERSSKDKSHSKGKENQDKKSDRKREDDESGKSFHDGDHKSKDDKKKDGKSKTVADDHHIHRDRDSDDRRSTDRDSSGTPRGRSVSSRRSGSGNHSSHRHGKRDSSNSGNQKSDGGGNSDSVAEPPPEDSSDQASVDLSYSSSSSSLPFNKHSLEEDSDPQEEYSCVINAGKLILKSKKPKIAANIFEAKKIMQLRKSMAKIERKKLKEQNKRVSIVVKETGSDSDEPLLFFTEEEAKPETDFIEFVRALEKSEALSSDESDDELKRNISERENMQINDNHKLSSSHLNETKTDSVNGSESLSDIKDPSYTNSSITLINHNRSIFNRELRVSVENCIPSRRTSMLSNSGRNENKSVGEIQELSKRVARHISRDSESSSDNESVCDENVDRFGVRNADYTVVNNYNHSVTSEPVSHGRYIDSTSSSDDDDDDDHIQRNNVDSSRGGYSYARDYNNVERSSSDDEKGGENMSLSNELILPALRDLMLESGFQLSDALESADLLTASGMPTPDSQGEMSEKQSSAGSGSSTSNASERKRPKLGRSRRVGLSRPHPSKRLEVGKRVSTPPALDADFVMPLSPESDVSASSVDPPQKVHANAEDEESSLSATAGTTNHCRLEDATEKKKHLRSSSPATPAGNDQVYNNEDMFKPQPLFVLQAIDPFPTNEVQEPTINCVGKRHRTIIDSEVPQTSKRMKR